MTTKSSEKNTGQSLFLNGTIPRAVFNFFASLQLAIGTLSALMVILAVGTIIESRFNADAARILVYDTPWLTLILVILVLNLACSAADRLPWQKKHIGFVLTHLGIIIILAGSLATQEAAVDGQMSMTEGTSGKWVTLREPMIYVYSQAFKEERMLPITERVLRWKGREKIARFQAEDKKAEILLTQFYPNVKSEEVWVAAEKGPAAIRVSLWNNFVNVTKWLADTPAARELPLGPATLKWADAFIEPTVATPQTSSVEIKSESGAWSIPLPDKTALPFEQSLADGATVKVLSVYQYAYVEENTLKEGLPPAHADNPAAVLEITKDGKTEKHTVFAQFPDFPTVHGKPDSEFGFQVRYADPRFLPSAERHELRFVSQSDGVYYQVANKEQLTQGKVVVGQEVQTGWMDLKFKIEEVLPQAKADVQITPLDDDDPSEAAVAAVKLDIHGSQTQSFWMTEGLQKSLMVEGGLFEMVYGRRQLPLGFEVMLKDFRIKFDPGTERPAAYESDVVVKDFTHGKSFEQTISMNKPLVYRGFHIYQAGYQQNPDGTETSIFAVARDPGIPMKYAGAAIMVFGILLMFYTRAYSSRNEKGLK